MDKLNIINYFLERGILLSPDFLDKIETDFNSNSFYEQLQKKTLSQPIVLNTDLFLYINEKDGYLNLDWIDFDSSKVIFEKYNSKEKYSKFLDISANNQFIENDNNSQLILLNK